MVTQTEKLNAVFSALADPTRRKIVERLSRQSEIPVSELARPFQMSLPAISRHLRVLEDARLIRRQRHGRVHQIRIDDQGLKDAQKWITRYAQAWETRFDAIDQILLNKKKKKGKQ